MAIDGLAAVPRPVGAVGSARRRILHLAADYPSANRPENTQAVRNFVCANDAVDHTVIALTRTSDPRHCNLLVGDEVGDPRVFSMRYWGLPLGVLLLPSMALVARRVAALLEAEVLKIDLVHAHKLCFEGIAGFLLARRLAVPLVCSVRGEAETKALRFLPHYAPLYRRVIEYSSRICYVSAWMRPELERRFPAAATKGVLLPNFCTGYWRPASQSPSPGRFVTILHLEVYRRKGLDRLLRAFAFHASEHPDATLDIIGRGLPESIARVSNLIDRLGLGGRAVLIGSMPQAELSHRLPTYAAMCLPSRNETFGMVYVEALLSGVPILYGRGTGVDGFMDGIEAAVGVAPASIPAIAAGLGLLHREHDRLRGWLVQRRSIVVTRFDSAEAVASYNRELGLAT